MRQPAQRQTLRNIGTCFLALGMVPLIAYEGVEAVRGRTACADDCQ